MLLLSEHTIMYSFCEGLCKVLYCKNVLMNVNRELKTECIHGHGRVSYNAALRNSFIKSLQFDQACSHIEMAWIFHSQGHVSVLSK